MNSLDGGHQETAEPLLFELFDPLHGFSFKFGGSVRDGDFSPAIDAWDSAIKRHNQVLQLANGARAVHLFTRGQRLFSRPSHEIARPLTQQARVISP